ncbi:MAG: DMT family transporter [Bacteroidia bacterium]|nr:DMT family transporter [Bacteroidia bacterium]
MAISRQQRALLYALGSVLCWSTVATAFKLALRDVGVPALVLYSTLTSALVLSAIVAASKRRNALRDLTAKDVLLSSIMGLLNPFAYYLVLFRAYDLLPAQEAQPLNYTWPIVLSLMAALLLGQKVRGKDAVAMLVSFCGVIVISTRGDVGGLHFTNPEGVALAVGSSVIWASYWILNMRSTIDPVLRLALNFCAGTVYIAVFVLLVGADLSASPSGALAAVYIGLFEMGLTFVLWMSALRHARSAATVSNLVYLSPFLSLLIIATVLGENIYPSTLIGLVLIVGGILWQQFGERSGSGAV